MKLGANLIIEKKRAWEGGREEERGGERVRGRKERQRGPTVAADCVCVRERKRERE